MAYFGVDPDRYGGWSEAEKNEELKNAEIPPDRELCGENEDED